MLTQAKRAAELMAWQTNHWREDHMEIRVINILQAFLQEADNDAFLIAERAKQNCPEVNEAAVSAVLRALGGAL
jgi:hypothetical protein